MPTQTVSHIRLKDMAARLLAASGIPPSASEVIAGILVEADLMGHTTHGVNLLPAYLAELTEGNMKASGEPRIVSDNGSAVVWDGDYLSGVWLTYRAVTEAIGRATEYPAVTYVIRRSHHIGCLAAYMPIITDQNLFGILSASDPSVGIVAPFGGTAPLLTPNPIAAGIPAGPDGPVIIDISSSVTAAGVVNRHKKSGEPLPEKWLLDADGNPTDDAATFGGEDSSTIMPLGGEIAGYKGYALALLIEAMTSGLAGYGRTQHPDTWGTSVFLQVINPAYFSGTEAFEREMKWLAAQCRGSKPRPGVDSVRVPGDRARSKKREAMEHGVAVEQELLDRIEEWSARLGV